MVYSFYYFPVATLATFASCPLYPAFGCDGAVLQVLQPLQAALYTQLLAAGKNANHACTVRSPGLVLGAFFGGFSGFLASRPATTETGQTAAPAWRGKITPITLARCAGRGSFWEPFLADFPDFWRISKLKGYEMGGALSLQITV